MTRTYLHRVFNHRILFAALVVGLLSILNTQQPAKAQAVDSLEFTPVCDECVYRISWNSAGADYYEVFVVDLLHPDGRRRIYKGPSGNAYVTVSGTQTAEIRACNRGGCSAATELPLIRDTRSNDDWKKNFRFTSPITLLHRIDDEIAGLTVGWPTDNVGAVSVDTTATGQRVCQKEPSEAVWNIGTRMKVSVAPDIDFTVKNREIIEHEAGSWSWFGDIEGSHEGTLTLTTDRCGDSVFMSIDSDAGKFVVQPEGTPNHVVYEVIVGDRPPDCHSAPITDAVPLFDVVDKPGVDMPRSGNRRVLRSRSVSIDISEFLNRFSSLAYLVGDDRSYDIARFLDTATSIEFLPGESVPLDLRHGVILTSLPDRWVWHGCVAGDSDSKARLIVDVSRKTVDVMIEQGNKVTSLASDRSGQYFVFEVAN